MNTICQSLGEEKCTGLSFYHSFTCCDTTSQFLGKGGKIILGGLESIPVLPEPFRKSLSAIRPVFKHLKGLHVSFISITRVNDVNDLRQDLFSKRYNG